MAFNSFLGKRGVIESILNNEKTDFLSSSRQRFLLKHFGSTIVSLFGWPLNVEQRLRARIIINYLREASGEILDVGCSYGTYTFEIARRQRCRVIGIDIDRQNLKTAMQIKVILGVENVTFLYRNILANNFSDRKFDAILASHIIEHIQNDRRALNEISRILKKDGLFVVATPYDKDPREYARPHLTSRSKSGNDLPSNLFPGGGHWRSGYNERGIISLLEDSSFGDLDISYVYLPKFQPSSEYLFPLVYPFSVCTASLCKKPSDIIVKAKKKAC